MQIKQITIEGDHDDLVIKRTERGAVLCAHDVAIHIDRNDSREDRYGVAWNAAKIVYGESKKGEPNATNSMIHDVFEMIDRVAGC